MGAIARLRGGAHVNPDPFADLARYYDVLMDHVDYDRWFMITTALAELLPPRFRHLDAACGTGVLARRLMRCGWNSVAIDLSPAMVRAARKAPPCPPAAVADLRALPFHQSVELTTCLFDSMNFLLEPDDLRNAIAQCAGTLAPGGILYFDVVTERMVTEFFEGQTWEEDNTRFSSRWRSTYDRRRAVVETTIRVNRGPESIVRERIYPLEFFAGALEGAGLTLWGMYDARTWRKPTPKAIRVDIVAAADATGPAAREFQRIRKQIATRLRELNY
jgi:SAM-dependent methyltransferase